MKVSTFKKKEREAINRIGSRKFSWSMVKLYNSLCVPCKLLTVKRTRRGLKASYKVLCPECQAKAKEICGGLLK